MTELGAPHSCAGSRTPPRCQPRFLAGLQCGQQPPPPPPPRAAGYSSKRFIFERAKELGVRAVVIDGPDSWSKVGPAGLSSAGSPPSSPAALQLHASSQSEGRSHAVLSGGRPCGATWRSTCWRRASSRNLWGWT